MHIQYYRLAVFYAGLVAKLFLYISRAGTFTGTSSNLLVAGFWSLVAGTSLVPVTGTSCQRF